MKILFVQVNDYYTEPVCLGVFDNYRDIAKSLFYYFKKKEYNFNDCDFKEMIRDLFTEGTTEFLAVYVTTVRLWVWVDEVEMNENLQLRNRK